MFAEFRTDAAFEIAKIQDFGAVSNDNRSYLQEALAFRPEHAENFLDRNIPLDHQDSDGQTALQYAINRGMSGIAKALIEKGADIHSLDNQENDALWTAVQHPQPDLELIELLMNKGANPHRFNAAGESAAGVAANLRNSRMMLLFQTWSYAF